MIENKEISALFHLIDDPDEEVYHTVSDRIISLGKAIIPNLENLWENTHELDIQERIEGLIHRLHFKELNENFVQWKAGTQDLLQGALLTARYHYPEIQPEKALQEIEKIRRNVWLELNNYLTPLEQVNVMSSILYNYHKLKGVETSYSQPDDFLINKTLESKKGNAISNGILYLSLCQSLDIPIKAINIPKQFILAYFDSNYEFLNPVEKESDKILFFIDPLNGQIYSHKDVDNYFKRIAVASATSYFKPMDNNRIVQHLVEELALCYDNEKNAYKMEELRSISNLLAE